MSKFAKFLGERISRSDIQRTDRASGVESSEETMKNLAKGPEASIRRMFSQENIEQDVIAYIAAQKKAGADLSEDGELVMFMKATQDLLSKINKKSKKSEE